MTYLIRTVAKIIYQYTNGIIDNMYVSLKSDCYFRKYGEIGIIIRPIVAIEEVVDENGAFFLEQLNYQPKSVSTIANDLSRYYEEETDVLERDLVAFYNQLNEDGFLNCSDNIANYEVTGFDYATLSGKLTERRYRVKAEESTSRFLSEFFKDTPYLESFHIELTSKCNERCVHCYIPHECKTEEIDHDFMKDVLKQCREMGGLTVVFSGGEPMLHPYFCEMLKYAKDLDFNVTVLSNLTLLSNDIMEALKYRHASCVNVSLYSLDSRVHDAITTVQGSCEVTKNNILKLIENNIPVQINLPIMKQNKESFQEVIEWSQDHKCSVVPDYLIMARYDHTVDNLDNRLDEEELEDVIRKLVHTDVVIQSNLMTFIKKDDEARVDPNDRICGVGMSTLCMVSNGDVYPCAGWQQYICGNIKERPLKEIWNESPQVKYLRRIRQSDYGMCAECDDRYYCLMCMSKNSNENPDGDIFVIPKIICDAARIYHKVIDEYRDEMHI